MTGSWIIGNSNAISKNLFTYKENEILKEIINLVLLEDKKIEENFKEVDFSWCRGIGGDHFKNYYNK